MSQVKTDPTNSLETKRLVNLLAHLGSLDDSPLRANFRTDEVERDCHVTIGLFVAPQQFLRWHSFDFWEDDGITKPDQWMLLGWANFQLEALGHRRFIPMAFLDTRERHVAVQKAHGVQTFWGDSELEATLKALISSLEERTTT